LIQRVRLGRRAESPTDHSPGQHPGLKYNRKYRSERAKDYFLGDLSNTQAFKSFALAGRLIMPTRNPGRFALPWAMILLGFQPVFNRTTLG
ncbi:MAG: hypothetical protein ACI4B3_02465, partial [Prevotella sp.]